MPDCILYEFKWGINSEGASIGALQISVIKSKCLSGVSIPRVLQSKPVVVRSDYFCLSGVSIPRVLQFGPHPICRLELQFKWGINSEGASIQVIEFCEIVPEFKWGINSEGASI